jgi:hypothetical protein
MLLKDVKSSRKASLAVFRQVQLQYLRSLSVLGSRKLSSGNGEHFWSASLQGTGLRGYGGRTGPQVHSQQSRQISH